MGIKVHQKVVLLDSSILNFLCGEKYQLVNSKIIQQKVKELAGQEIRTDSVYISGFIMLEILGITLERLKKSHPEIFKVVTNSGDKISDIFKLELEITIKILRKFDEFGVDSIKRRYQEQLTYQSPEGKLWLESFLGFHINKFSIAHHENLIRRIAAEILIGRKFDGFDVEELGLQFAVMYITGIVNEDPALATPRAIDKIIAPLTMRDPNKFLSDVALKVKDFQEAQKYRPKEELVDVEMTQNLVFGHNSDLFGTRGVVAFTCESPNSVEARLNGVAGFLVTYRSVHKKSFLPGEVFCLDKESLDVLKHFKVDNFIQKQIKIDESNKAILV